MPITNSLKTKVDLPVWEWCRFAPTATSAVSAATTGNNLANRYIYYLVSSLFYRYDTITDSWGQLQSPLVTPTIYCSIVLTNSAGHYGKIIGPGPGNNTIQMAALHGNSMVGYKIRITDGTGAGQERTITAVSSPTIHDRGELTTASASIVTDANTGMGLKRWRFNQWQNYQIRYIFGSVRQQIRPILYNSTNTLSFSDANLMGINAWTNCDLTANAAVGTHYVIESHIVTVDSDWDVKPDNTSSFVVLSRGIWAFTQGQTSTPFVNLQYYDVLADYWYRKCTHTALTPAVLTAASDVKLERITEVGGPVLGPLPVVSGLTRGIITSGLTPMEYANLEIRIVSGLGIGQEATILSNTVSGINIYKDWTTVPDETSQYSIYRDVGKVWIAGGGRASLWQYSMTNDVITTGKQFDGGQINQMSAVRSGQPPISIATITRSTGGITSLSSTPTAAGSGYGVDDLLTLTGSSPSSTARVLTVSSTGQVLTVALESPGAGNTTGTGKATTGGTGTGCTLNIISVDVIAVATTSFNHNLKIGDTVTIYGATGVNASYYNGSRVITGVSAATTFTFAFTSGTPAGNATYTATTTATVVDVNKNWVVNEHVGRLVMTYTNSPTSTANIRKIVSNTANTLTWTLALSGAPASGTQYVIFDAKPFGTERSLAGQLGGGTEGFATGGTTESLIDSTKNWPIDYWLRGAARKIRITEGTGVGNEITITGNTATTISYATQTFIPDTTTRYIIMDNFGICSTTGSATTLTDTSQQWEPNMLIGKRVLITGGTGAGYELAITANTATALTFAGGPTSDTSTTYAILEATPKTYGISLDSITGTGDAAIDHKYLYSFVGSTYTELQRYNITTEHWETLLYFPQSETLTTGSMYVYDGHQRIYFTKDATGRIYYYDILENIVHHSSTIPYGMSTAVSGNRMEIIETEDDLKYLYVMRHSGQEMWRTLIYW